MLFYFLVEEYYHLVEMTAIDSILTLFLCWGRHARPIAVAQFCVKEQKRGIRVMCVGCNSHVVRATVGRCLIWYHLEIRHTKPYNISISFLVKQVTVLF